jgi:hypothetical protein
MSRREDRVMEYLGHVHWGMLFKITQGEMEKYKSVMFDLRGKDWILHGFFRLKKMGEYETPLEQLLLIMGVP